MNSANTNMFSDSEHHTNRNRELLLILLFVAVAFICYGSSIGGDFVHDDDYTVVKNLSIQSIKTLPNIFRENLWANKYGEGLYRPMTSLSFAFNYAIGGFKTWNYHLLNILLHCLNSYLIYLLVHFYLKRRVAAIITTLLFIVHPVHVEAVSNITGRSELLSGCFSLLSWYCYSQLDRDIRYYRLGLACFLLALLSKESAIVLIGVLVLTDLAVNWQNWFKRLPQLTKYYAGYIGVTLSYIVIRLLVLNAFVVPETLVFFRKFTLWARILTMSHAFMRYFYLMLWPKVLISDYDLSIIPAVDTLNFATALRLGIIIALFVVGVWMLWYRRVIGFAIIFFFITMSTVSNILPTGLLIAERVLYIPIASICLIVGVLLDRLYHNSSAWRVVSLILLSIMLLLSVVRDYQRNKDWLSKEAFVDALLRDAPGNPKGYIGKSALYQINKDYQSAEQELLKAVAVAPDKAATHGTLGLFYQERGRYDDAQIYLERSIQIFPKYEYVFLSLARTYSHKKMYQEAIAAYQKAISMEAANLPAVYQELAMVFLNVKDQTGAVLSLEKALDLKPDYAEAHFNLGLILRSAGQLDQSLNHFQKTIELEPNNPQNYYQAGIVLLNQGRLNEATNAFLKAISLNENFAEAHNNLGVAYIQLNQLTEARQEFEKALSIKPDYSNAAGNLARIKKDTTNE